MAPEAPRPWRERRPEGWDGTGRMSLNEWWDDLIAPSPTILVIRLVILGIAVFVALAAPPGTLIAAAPIAAIALLLRLRGQEGRRRPWMPPRQD